MIRLSRDALTVCCLQTLLLSVLCQGYQRGHGRRSSCRQPAGEQTYGQQDHGHDAKHYRVARAHAEQQRRATMGAAYVYDVAPNGQRFLVAMPSTDLSQDSPLTVTTNWPALLKK
ncbi:MAG: hypothetical protein ABIP90_04415 [Vicinamibacterales bacterium]